MFALKGRLLLVWIVAAGGFAPLHAQPACQPLAPPQGAVIEVYPHQADSLAGLVAGAAAGTTILLHDGLYEMDGGDPLHRLNFRTADVTLRSASGEPSTVVLDGGYDTGELISIQASNITVAGITLMRAYYHPIHISGMAGQPISGVVVHNVRIVDPGEQAIKINSVGDGWADHGIIQCSSLELTATGRSQVRNSCYTGGVDAHNARGWIVRRNWIEGFWCASGLSEHGVHFWRSSRDTLVEQNVILDCARGVGFGLTERGGGDRTYPDDPYPGVPNKGHIDGVIRNNFIAASNAGLFGSQFGFDTGIGLEQAHGVQVVHNTVVSNQTPASSSMEWRFTGTSAALVNNLTSHDLKPRDGAQAVLTSNLTGAVPAWFVALAAGDLHLTLLAQTAIDSATPLSAHLAGRDIDDDGRGATPDVGADEWFGPVFGDGFESGDVSAWSVSQ